MVVSIISLLASVILASVNSARAKARNAVRTQNIRTLVLAFTQAINSGANISSIPNNACVTATCYGGWSGTQNSTVGPYMSTALVDPTDGNRTAEGVLFGTFGSSISNGGDTFPAGSYLDWMMEGPYNSQTCSPAGATATWGSTAGSSIEYHQISPWSCHGISVGKFENPRCSRYTVVTNANKEGTSLCIQYSLPHRVSREVS